VWAEPDISAAAEQLAALHGDGARRNKLGVQAAADMEARRAALLAGTAFDALEQALVAPRPAPGDFGAALKAAHDAVGRQRFRDKIVAVKRRLGLRG
jgi:hypothetical protein